MKILVPMAGPSTDFEESGYRFPKNLVEIGGRSLVERVLEQLRPLVDDGAELICLVRDEEDRHFHTSEVIRLLVPEATVITVPELDSGAACTALLAVDYIGDGELLVFNGDQLVLHDLRVVVAEFRDRGLDGGVVVFNAVHPRWSYVRTDETGLVTEAAEKRPISTHATAGTYWFRQGDAFLDAVMSMIRKDASVDGRFYVCPAYNEMVLLGKAIGTFEIPPDAYVSLSTPQGVQHYDDEFYGRQEKGRT